MESCWRALERRRHDLWSVWVPNRCWLSPGSCSLNCLGSLAFDDVGFGYAAPASNERSFLPHDRSPIGRSAGQNALSSERFSPLLLS